jgi:rSAM/selenodomain-associated transferase 1
MRTDGQAHERAARCAIAIMAKESRPGSCKTRLVPPLSPAEAAEANTCFLRDIAGNIVAASASAPAAQGVAAYHPLGSEAFFEAILPEGFLLLPPREPGIGRSLFHAARDLLAAGFGSVCLVNSDSPTLPTRFLVETMRLLAKPGDRVVLGPSADGGYYLIGLKRFHARLFEDVAWSTERVLAQSLERAAEIGLEAALLPGWYDVDDASCLERLRRELSGAGDEGEEGYHAPHTRAWLGLADPAPSGSVPTAAGRSA